ASSGAFAMRISLNWLRDYLDIKPEVDVAQISSSLTLAGLEVEGIEDVRALSSRFGLAPVISVHMENDRCDYFLDQQGDSIRVTGEKSALTPGMIVAYAEKDTNNAKEYVLGTFGDLGFLVQANDVIAFDKQFFDGAIPENLSLVKEFDD